MKYVSIFFLLFCLSSCEYFDKKKISTEEILQEDLKTFNWNEVDEYPSFNNCSSSATKALRKQCFESTLSNHIVAFLVDKRIIVTQNVNDTIRIKFNVSEKGELAVQDIESGDVLKTQIPDLNKFLIESLDNLPEISPAIKRGQQVKTQFTLPVIIKAAN